jgi:hypothetical protein
MLTFGEINTAEKAAHCAGLCIKLHRQVQTESRAKGREIPLRTHWLDMAAHFTALSEEITLKHGGVVDTSDADAMRTQLHRATFALEMVSYLADAVAKHPDALAEVGGQTGLDNIRGAIALGLGNAPPAGESVQ